MGKFYTSLFRFAGEKNLPCALFSSSVFQKHRDCATAEFYFGTKYCSGTHSKMPSQNESGKQEREEDQEDQEEDVSTYSELKDKLEEVLPHFVR